MYLVYQALPLYVPPGTVWPSPMAEIHGHCWHDYNRALLFDNIDCGYCHMRSLGYGTPFSIVIYTSFGVYEVCQDPLYFDLNWGFQCNQRPLPDSPTPSSCMVIVFTVSQEAWCLNDISYWFYVRLFYLSD